MIITLGRTMKKAAELLQLYVWIGYPATGYVHNPEGNRSVFYLEGIQLANRDIRQLFIHQFIHYQLGCAFCLIFRTE